jgi:23S rRNA pseudouridine2605 synthase
MSLIRLNHFLSQSGISSRRGADSLIEKGNVKIDGKVVKTLGLKVDPEIQTVEILKERNNTYAWKRIEAQQEKITIALYKPKGFVTSMKKQGSAPIISSLVPTHKRLFPIGRLDKDSEGLIILTNDGDLSQKLMHPTHHIPKIYRVTCITPKDYNENILKSKLGRLSKGATIKNRQTQAAEIKLLEFSDIRHRAELLITLHKNRNRQIRRMLGTIDLEVIILTRIAIGGLTLEKLQLKSKQSVTLSEEHIALLL